MAALAETGQKSYNGVAIVSKMELAEVVQGVDRLLAVSGSYNWQPGRFHNLESSKYIVDPNGGDAHGFVTGKEVAWAVSRAMA